jgi:hypothetical protein
MRNLIVELLLFHHLLSLGNQFSFFFFVFFLYRNPIFRYRDNQEIRQSTKHLKKYDRNNYKLEIKRCIPDDKGEYIVRASNSYGEKEYAVFLTVECKYHYKIIILHSSVFR